MTVAIIERQPAEARMQGVGLRLDEVKGLIAPLQQIVAEEQAAEVVAALSQCSDRAVSLYSMRRFLKNVRYHRARVRLGG